MGRGKVHEGVQKVFIKRGEDGVGKERKQDGE
jgi:hypothetical protein